MLQIVVFNSKQHFQDSVQTVTLTIGSALPTQDDLAQAHIRIDDKLVSNMQCRVELVDRGGQQKIAIFNLGSCIVLGDGNRLHQGVSEELDLPCSIYAGDSQIEISAPTVETAPENPLRQIPVIGWSSPADLLALQNIDLSPAPATLNSWFEALSQIQRSTASHSGFFKLAARAVFNPGGLDGCIILKRHGDDWEIVSQHLPYPEYGISYRSDLVDQAKDKKSVIYHGLCTAEESQASGQQHAAVVCPVFDADDNITAMVYGFRSNHRRNNRRGIRDLEAKFVSLIADAISAGMIRLNHEASGARRRVLLQQAFSPGVAERLESDPDFPAVENREISVLFADIRNFCMITETLGCYLTYHLLSDVMDRFTMVIHEHEGVVIDYYGDGISAFWNAPVDQPKHPLLACQAAAAITKSLDDINAKWTPKIGRELEVGVGVTTGDAQIGNSGSSLRLKYGPQGTTVNIASRLEQSTKKTGVNFVVSGATAARVEGEFFCNRICTANFSGISQPIDVVQLIDPTEAESQKGFFAAYQQALSLFDHQNYLDAVTQLMAMCEEYPEEPLVEFLLNKSVSRLSDRGQTSAIVVAAKRQLGKTFAETIELSSAVRF